MLYSPKDNGTYTNTKKQTDRHRQTDRDKQTETNRQRETDGERQTDTHTHTYFPHTPFSPEESVAPMILSG